MQIRPLEDLTKEELNALIQQERRQYEAVGAGGVALMGDSEPGYMQIAFAQMKAIAAKDSEIAALVADIESYVGIANELAGENERLREALAVIGEWQPPYVLSQGEMVPMSIAIGSNGERDYFRGIARTALTQQEQA